jgi:hypothetical protein
VELDARLVFVALDEEDVAVPDVVALEMVDDEMAVVA